MRQGTGRSDVWTDKGLCQRRPTEQDRDPVVYYRGVRFRD